MCRIDLICKRKNLSNVYYMNVACITILGINMLVQILNVFLFFYVSRAKLNGMGERHMNGTLQKSDNIADGLTVYYRSR